jgi:hypothetical protein
MEKRNSEKFNELVDEAISVYNSPLTVGIVGVQSWCESFVGNRDYQSAFQIYQVIEDVSVYRPFMLGDLERKYILDKLNSS